MRDEHTNAAADGAASHDDRAERIASETERAAEQAAAKAADWIAHAAARIREEAEDIWADAQAVRRSWQS
jgi:vacuolar-type H+-ATPase subunit H